MLCSTLGPRLMKAPPPQHVAQGCCRDRHRPGPLIHASDTDHFCTCPSARTGPELLPNRKGRVQSSKPLCPHLQGKDGAPYGCILRAQNGNDVTECLLCELPYSLQSWTETKKGAEASLLQPLALLSPPPLASRKNKAMARLACPGTEATLMWRQEGEGSSLHRPLGQLDRRREGGGQGERGKESGKGGREGQRGGV